MDSGDVLTGRPYGYTEEYQSYEQTGVTPASWGCGYMINYASWNNGFGGAINAQGNYYDGQINLPICTAEKLIIGYDGNGSGKPVYGCSYHYRGYGCARGDYWNTPIYGYVTRTRTVMYDKQSGLFSIGIGVPYAARNTGLYSTRHADYHHGSIEVSVVLYAGGNWGNLLSNGMFTSDCNIYASWYDDTICTQQDMRI